MKKITILLFTTCCLLFAPGCKKIIDGIVPAVPPVPEAPTPTETGTPVGNAATKNIGTSGGTIISTDGKIELDIPAGALTGNTDIAIQAITNNAPNGVSNAYRFTPDKMKFSTPATLKFHYADGDVAGSLSGLLGIAFQDSIGIWWRTNNFSIDLNGKTIAVPMSHFSDWSMFEVMKISPDNATLRVNQTMSMEIEVVNTGSDADELAQVYKTSSKITWQASAGQLSGPEDQKKTYTAPAGVPAQNPVAVSVKVPIRFVYKGQSYDNTSLVSNVTIYDGDEVYLLEIKQKETNWFPGILATDSVSMRIKIQDTTVTVSNISNFAWKSYPETLVIGNSTIAWVPDPPEGFINITNATGDITVDFLGPNTRFLGLHFTNTATHNPRYHKTTPPDLNEYWGGEVIDGNPGGFSINLITGQSSYGYENDVVAVRLTLQQ